MTTDKGFPPSHLSVAPFLVIHHLRRDRDSSGPKNKRLRGAQGHAFRWTRAHGGFSLLCGSVPRLLLRSGWVRGAQERHSGRGPDLQWTRAGRGGTKGLQALRTEKSPCIPSTTAALPTTPCRPQVRQQLQTGRPRKDHTALQAQSPLGPRGLAGFWAPVAVSAHGQRTHGRWQRCAQGGERARHCLGGCVPTGSGTGLGGRPLLSALSPPKCGGAHVPWSWLPSTTPKDAKTLSFPKAFPKGNSSSPIKA